MDRKPAEGFLRSEDSAGNRSNLVFPGLDKGLSCHHRRIRMVSWIDPMAV
jgi:hypothetical protein